MRDNGSGIASSNVTDDQLRTFLDLFFRHIADLSVEFLPGHAHQLFHTSHLPARIIGYNSNRYGVGFEMRRAPVTSIEVIHGDERVEDLVWADAPRNLRDREPPFILEDCQTVLIMNFTIEGSLPIRLAGDSDNITLVNVTTASPGGYERHIDLLSLSSRRHAELWTPERAVAGAAAEVLAASAELRLAQTAALSIEDFVRQRKEGMVLLLGSYQGDGDARLARIADSLRRLDYEPFRVADIPDYPSQSLQQKVAMLGNLARFVIIDDTDPSGHLVEMSIVASNNWITVSLQGHGRPTTYMVEESAIFHPTFRALPFDSSNPDPAIREAVGWAEQQFATVARAFNDAYPWRVGFGAHHD